MKLSNLTSENLILLDAVFNDRFAAIEALTDKIDQAGKLTNKQQFLDAVMLRESEGPTALGEYLAVPHGKSAAVIEPTFACAFVKDELMWQGIDGDEPVNMVFLIAIPPAEAGSTHMEVLTTLTSSLVDDDFRDELLAANSTQQIMKLLGSEDDCSQDASNTHSETKSDSESQKQEEPEMAKDISQIAYPVVLGIGLVISAFLFLLL
ncbi:MULTISPECIES: fructose PTS transporter subunit IIA [Vibrio]|uniref:fructose PTS transporter subunit IIA n=1 Tax=Vibrio TaxID=662 RepID=UPI000D3A8721|nr:MULTISPECIES: fructose PTS transporter subunit IIA [Vibrio]MCC4878394.1 fructose PTS transporter subunit IIA [Vibrio splendidus]PTO71043.1 PTS glucose transporter subunit IIA [Vibrio splendidus]PTO89433.1 PTS glucose transporter subunit IIA [Vibrio splendidus]PTP28422.1 PTS glucose transporter subunit IIA [Vibrio splendidus]PTP49880.1 PTS glucose transporter subunit IIA [Vibrio splendidus]